MVKVFKSDELKAEVYQSYDILLKLSDTVFVEQDVNTTYGTTHVIKYGNPKNKPLFMFHGVGDNSALMWIYNIKSLSEHFFVIAVDTIGGPGKSIPNQNYNKAFDQIKWIDELLDYFSFDAVNLCGLSYGTYLTQLYSIKRYERVGRAVCMAGALFTEKSKNVMIQMLKVFLPAALFPTPSNANKIVCKLTGENKKVFLENQDIMKHYLILLKSFNNQAMFYHKMIKFSKEDFNKIRNKVLFLIGKMDVLAYSTEVIGEFKENGIQYKEYNNVGHAINHEIADEINREIVSFINEPNIT